MSDNLAEEAQENLVKTSWWLVRHGPVINPKNLIYGVADPDIDTSDEGLYLPLAIALPKDAIYFTSTRERTQKTLKHVARVGGFEAPPSEQISGFDEQSFGDWEGLTWDHLFRDGRSHTFWLAPAKERVPGGESFEDLTQRVSESLTELSRKYSGKKIVLFAHGGTIRAALACALGLDGEAALRFSIDNCGITQITHLRLPDSSETWHIKHVNISPSRPHGFSPNTLSKIQ